MIQTIMYVYEDVVMRPNAMSSYICSQKPREGLQGGSVVKEHGCLGVIPGPSWWKERTYSDKSSSTSHALWCDPPTPAQSIKAKKKNTEKNTFQNSFSMLSKLQVSAS